MMLSIRQLASRHVNRGLGIGIIKKSWLPNIGIDYRRHSTADRSFSKHRRTVTVVSDTGQVPWKELSVWEKAARTTQQALNVGLLLVGVAMTGAVATVLYVEVFSRDSKTAIFNRAADQVRRDRKCQELLVGDMERRKEEIRAYGEPSWSRWARNRTISSRLEKDKAGIEHLHMHFYVEGPKAKGTVILHMFRLPNDSDFRYNILALDVPGKARYYLENSEMATPDKRKQGKMFGVRWN